MLEQIHYAERRQIEHPHKERQIPARGNGRAVPDIAVSDRETKNILFPVIAWCHVH